MFHFKRYIRYCLPFCLFSCLTEMEIDMEPTPPRMVLNASVGTEQDLSAQLTKSWFITEQPVNESLKDACIRVYINDQEQGVMLLADDTAQSVPCGQYVLPGCRLHTGDRLQLRAEAPDLPPVSAQVEMPPCTEILTVDTLPLHPSSYVGDMQLFVRFKDQANEKNYYRLVVRKETEYWKGDSLITTVAYGESSEGVNYSFIHNYYGAVNSAYYPYDWFFIHYDDPVFRPSGSSVFPDKLESYSCWGSFTDDPIDGQEYTLKSVLSSPTYSYQGDSVTSVVHYDVQLLSVTTAYYQYMKSVWRFAISGFPLDALKEPASAYSNVEGGYGVVSGYQISSRRITMPFGTIPPYYTPFSYPYGSQSKSGFQLPVLPNR